MYIPGPLIIGVFIAWFIFYYYNQKTKIRSQQRRQDLQEKKQQQLDALLKKPGKENKGD